MNAVVKGDPKARPETGVRRSDWKFKAALVGVALTMTAVMLPSVLLNHRSEKPALMEKQRATTGSPAEAVVVSGETHGLPDKQARPELTIDPVRYEFAKQSVIAADTLFKEGNYGAAAIGYGHAAKAFKELGQIGLENLAYFKQVQAYDAAIKEKSEMISYRKEPPAGSDLKGIRERYLAGVTLLQRDLKALKAQRAAAQRNYEATLPGSGH